MHGITLNDETQGGLATLGSFIFLKRRRIMEILIQFALLVVGFVLLIKGADVFVDGASSLAKKFGIPQLVIGLTIVAMGTSLPEAAVSISAAAKGSADIAVGNVIGSNILNVLLILGLSAAICPLAVQKTTFKYEIPFTIVISAIFAFLGLRDNTVGFVDGIILWALFLLYLGYLFYITKKGLVKDETDEADKDKNIFLVIFYIIIGAALIVSGSNVTVDSAKKIAAAFGMSERLIGLTIVALGTSLPELVTSVIAAIKGKTDIAVGNIVGSNLFNILFVIGTSSLILPLIYQSAFLIDSIVCIGVMALLWLLLVNKKRQLTRTGGIIMLVAFLVYMVNLISMSM